MPEQGLPPFGLFFLTALKEALGSFISLQKHLRPLGVLLAGPNLGFHGTSTRERTVRELTLTCGLVNLTVPGNIESHSEILATQLVEFLVWQLGFYMLPGEYNMKRIDNHSLSCLLSLLLLLPHRQRSLLAFSKT